jgi:membrane protease YdiL (CAAX protease family)
MSKGEITAAFIEPFILYWLLFLPAWGPASPPDAEAVFSLTRELGRMFTYSIPALALIWYLLLLPGSAPSPVCLRPRTRDLGTVLAALPGLLALGVLVSLAGTLFGGTIPAPAIGAPRGLAAFLVMILSCLSTAYLEESYFRIYLWKWFKEGGVGPAKSMIISSLLFSLCHLYEGPLGAVNAFLAGLLLFFIFTRRQSIHGIAWAHGGYNVCVYVMAAAGN